MNNKEWDVSEASIAMQEGAGSSLRIAYDPAVWQRQEQGDFIHVKTGEIRDEDGFDFSDRASEENPALGDDWDAPQDEGADESGSQVRHGRRG